MYATKKIKPIIPKISKSLRTEAPNASALLTVALKSETRTGSANLYIITPMIRRANIIARIEYSTSSFFFAIGHPSFSLHLMHNLLHGKLTQIASCLSLPESRSGVPRQSQQRLSFSFLLSKMYGYYSFIALKYVKVGKVNIQEMV